MGALRQGPGQVVEEEEEEEEEGRRGGGSQTRDLVLIITDASYLLLPCPVSIQDGLPQLGSDQA